MIFLKHWKSKYNFGVRSFLLIFSIFFYILFSNNVICAVQYYEVEAPYRKYLQEKYEEYSETSNTEQLDVRNVHKQYEQRNQELKKQEQKEVETKEIKKQEEEQKSERKELVENKTLPDDTKTNTTLKKNEEKTKEKEKDKSWIDDWVVKSDKVPHDIVGAYTSIRLALTLPLNIKNFSATETTRLGENYTNRKLFTGNAEIGLMPAFYVASGNDSRKWFRWEFELGYIPFRATSLKYQSATNMRTYTFLLDKKQLSLHILSGGVNVYFQRQFFSNKIVGFIGCGVALGYAWSWDRNLSSDFILPIVKGAVGFSMLVREKAKLTISYTLSYLYQVDIPNKYQFVRSTGGVVQQKQAIYNGSLKFGDIIIQGIQFEYQFYV